MGVGQKIHPIKDKVKKWRNSKVIVNVRECIDRVIVSKIGWPRDTIVRSGIEEY